MRCGPRAIYNCLGALIACLLKVREHLAGTAGTKPTDNEDEVIADILAELTEEVSEEIVETALEAALS